MCKKKFYKLKEQIKSSFVDPCLEHGFTIDHPNRFTILDYSLNYINEDSNLYNVRKYRSL